MTNDANWAGGSAPASGSAWVFTNSSTTALANGFNDYTIGGITFTANATNTTSGAAYTMGGNAFTLTGGITNQSAANQIISNNLTINSAVTLTNTAGSTASYISLYGAISGDKTVTFGAVNTGGSRLQLLGNNTNFTGTFIANSSRVVFFNANSASSNADYILNSDIRLATAGVTNNFGSLSGSGIIAANGATVQALAVGHKNTSTTFSGNISSNNTGATGSMSLTKTGTGTLTLSGTNTYNGATTISNGVLRIGEGGTKGSFSNTTSITLAGGSLAFDRSDNISQGGSFLANGSAISGTGGLIKLGGGTLSLNATNTYSGDTVVSAGALRLSNAAAIQNSALNLDGGALLFDSSLSTATFGGLKGSGNLTLTNGTNGAVALTLVNAASTASTYAGNLGGTASSLTLSGAGTQTLSGNNTYSGGTTLNSGTLGVGHSSALGSGTLTVAGNSTLLAAADALTLANNASLNSGTLAIDVQNFNLSSSGAISSTGALTKAGAGTLTLTGANSYNGGTLVSAGTLAGDTAGLQGNITNNAVVAFDQSTTGAYAGILSGSGSLLKLGSGTVTLSAANTQSGGTLISAGTLQIGNGGTTGSLAGVITNNATLAYNRSDNITQATVISGSGSLTKAGDGTLTLSGNNTYTGKTTITGGTVFINADTRFGTAPGTFTADQLSLDGGGFAVANSFTMNANRGITLGTAGGTIEVGSGSDLTIGATAAGAGALTKNGEGVLRLTTNTYAGGLVLNAGSLRPTQNSVVSNGVVTSGPAGTGTFTINGGRIMPGGAGGVYANQYVFNADFAVNSGAFGTANNGLLSLAGPIDLTAGTRTVSLGRWTNAAAVLSGSGQESLRLFFNNGLVTTLSNGTLRVVREASGTASDYVGLSLQSGNTFFSGAGLTIGTNVITTMSTNNPFGTAAGDQPNVTVEAGGFFNMSDAANARSPQIRTLSGGGTVTSLANAAASSTSTLTINAQSGDSATFSGTIVDGSSLNATLGTSAANVAVALVKSGDGTQILAGNNTYSGSTLISGGTLRVGAGGTSGTLGSGNVTNSGGTLIFNRSDAVTVANIISGGGPLTQAGSGTLTLTASNTYTGATVVEQGTLVVDGALASSQVTVNDDATLAGSGTLGATTILSGGTISPGNSPGTLTLTNGLTWNGGGNYNWQIYDADSTEVAGWDLIAVTGGNWNISGLSETNRFNLNLWSLSGINADTNGAALDFVNTQSYTWRILSATNIVGTFNTNLFTINVGAFNGTGGFANNTGGGLFSLALDGNDLNLLFQPGATPVPEPGTWAAGGLLSILAAAAAARRRRQMKWRSTDDAKSHAG